MRLRPRPRTIIVVLAFAALLGLCLAEFYARVGLGLGDPPLSVADDTMEYRFRPGDYRRFGNRVLINEQSMRGDPLPAGGSADAERPLRVLALGDSVVNGGAQTDQDDLATAILQRELTAALGRPIWVGNVSAGSWGPGNLLAYVKKFGAFDADAAVIVLSSHDAADNPRFDPVVGVDPSFPDRKPWLAIEEAVTRYLPRYLPSFGSTGEDSQVKAVNAEPSAEAIAQGLADLRALVEELERRGIARDRILIAQHLERTELGDLPDKVGHERIRAEAGTLGIEIVQLDEPFAREESAGRSPYRDDIHPNAQGQTLIAELLRPWLETVLRERLPGSHQE